MTDSFAIGAALSGIKAAIDIAKALRSADLSLEKAEMKLKIAELLEALADAKISISEFNDVVEEKDNEINSLRKAFELKEKLIRKGNYYVLENDPEGEVNKYCLTCWDYEQKLVSLIMVGRGNIKCNICASRNLTQNK